MKPPPGMKMTDAQWGLYLDLWNKAARAQGWPVSSRAHRLAVHREVFGREVSAKEIDRKAGFDAIKAKFLELAGSVDGAIEAEHPEIGEARRWRVVIGESIAALALYTEDADGYVSALVRDMFGRFDAWEDLGIEERYPGGDSETELVMKTLAARVDGLRRQAGDTVAEMRRKAKKLARVRREELVPW